MLSVRVRENAFFPFFVFLAFLFLQGQCLVPRLGNRLLQSASTGKISGLCHVSQTVSTEYFTVSRLSGGEIMAEMQEILAAHGA